MVADATSLLDSGPEDQLSNSQPDKRSAIREPYIEQLSFSSGNSIFDGRSKNISSFGLFIETAAELEVGEEIDVILTFISSGTPLKLKAMITRKTEEGVGAFFEVLTASKIEEIEAVIAQHVDL